MKNVYNLILALSLVFISNLIVAQTIWTGPNVTFTKVGGADWTLEENQDRITDSVWITRANNKGIFNIVTETEYEGDDVNGPSPKGTEWAFGNISDGIENLTFTTWAIAADGNPPGVLVNQPMVLHLISEDIYMNIKFLSWAIGMNGMGGFSYERNSDETTSIGEVDFLEKKSLIVHPNPASSFIFIQDLKEAQNIKIFNLLGENVYHNRVDVAGEINIEFLPTGVYFIRSENGRKATFVKQ